jgi:hypothetical protein
MSPTARRRRIAHIVTKVFGLSGLRPGQQAVIDAVLAGRHTLAIMPTGAGMFHAATLVLTLIGVVMLWSDGVAGVSPRHLSVLIGQMILGWGLFSTRAPNVRRHQRRRWRISARFGLRTVVAAEDVRIQAGRRVIAVDAAHRRVLPNLRSAISSTRKPTRNTVRMAR